MGGVDVNISVRNLNPVLMGRAEPCSPKHALKVQMPQLQTALVRLVSLHYALK